MGISSANDVEAFNLQVFRAWVGRCGTEVKQVGIEYAWLVLMEELFLYMQLANWATLRGRQRTRSTMMVQSCQNEHAK